MLPVEPVVKQKKVWQTPTIQILSRCEINTPTKFFQNIHEGTGHTGPVITALGSPAIGFANSAGTYIISLKSSAAS